MKNMGIPGGDAKSKRDALNAMRAKCTENAIKTLLSTLEKESNSDRKKEYEEDLNQRILFVLNTKIAMPAGSKVKILTLVWLDFIKNNKTMDDVKTFLGNDLKHFSDFCEAGLRSCKKKVCFTGSGDLSLDGDEKQYDYMLNFFLKNIETLETLDNNPVISLIQHCLSNKSVDFITSMFQDLKIKTYPDIAVSAECILENELIAFERKRQDVKKFSKEFVDIVSSSLNHKDDKAQAWILSLAFVVCAMHDLEGKDQENLKAILNIAKEKGIDIDKAVFIKLYEKIRVSEKSPAWVLDIAEEYLKKPLFTIEELIKREDPKSIFALLEKGFLEEDSEKIRLLNLLIESNKISPQEKNEILDKMIEKGLVLDAKRLDALIRVVVERKKHISQESAVFEHLLSKGSIEDVINILVPLEDVQKMNLRLFAQIQNDAELSGSGLQGQKNMWPVVRHLKILTSILSNRDLAGVDNEKIKSFKRLLDTYTEVEDIISESQADFLKLNRYEANYRSMLEIYKRKYAKKIIELMDKGTTTNRILLPFGWGNDEESGHAMLLCIEKIANKKYRVIIFNTGAGLEYHSHKILGNKEKFCPIRVFEELSETEVVDCVSNSVMAKKAESCVQGIGAKVFDKESLYKAFSDFPEKETEFPFVTPQRSGTCTAKIFSPVERWIFGEQFGAYKYLLKLRTNEYYLKQIHYKIASGDSPTAEELAQLEYSLRNFARFLIKLRSTALIPLEDIERSTKKVTEDIAFVETCNAKRQEWIRQENEKNVLLEINQDHSVRPYVDQFSGEPNYSESNQDVTSVIWPLDFCNHFVLSKNELSDEIEKIARYQNKKLHQASKIMLENLFKKILMGNIKIDYKDDQEALEVIKNMNYLIGLYRVACAICDQAEVSSKAALYNMVALSIVYNAILEKKIGKEKNFLNSFGMKGNMENFKKIFKQLAEDSIFFHAHTPEFYPILQAVQLNVASLNKENLSEYQYISERYTKLATIMEILAEEAYQSKKNEFEKQLKGRKPESWEQPEPLKDKEKYALIKTFFYDREGFVAKALLLERNEKIKSGLSNEAVLELEALKTDSALASALSKMTQNLENIAEKSIRTDGYKKTIPFQYRDATFDSKVVQFILHQGYAPDLERELWENTRETDPNKLQHLVNSSAVKKTFSKKEMSIIQRLMSARVHKENQIFSTIEFFKNNIALLLNNEYQVLLHCFLFEPGLVQKELASNKNLRGHIVSFLNEVILKHRSDLSVLSSGAFLYETASFLQEFISDNEEKGQNEIEQLLNKIPQEIERFQKLEREGGLTDEQILAYGRLCKVHLLQKLKSLRKGSLPDVEFYALYAAYIKVNQLSLKTPLINTSTKELDAKISELFAFCEVDLCEKFKDEKFKDTILEEILKKMVPSWELKNKFSGAFPIFHAIDLNGEPVTIDLKTGRCLKKSLEAGHIPQKIRENPFFVEKFGDINPPALISVLDGSFEFNANGHDRKLLKNLQILTKINGVWCKERETMELVPNSIQKHYLIFDADEESFFEAKDKKDTFGLCAKIELDGKKRLYLTELGVVTAYRLRSSYQGYDRKEEDESAILMKNLSAFVEGEDIEIYDNTIANSSNSEPPLQIKIPSYHLHLICKKYPDDVTGKWHLFLKDKPNYRLMLDFPKPIVIKDFSYWLPFEDVSTEPKEIYGLFPVKKFSGENKDRLDMLPSFPVKENLKRNIFELPFKKNVEKSLFCKIELKKNKLIPAKGDELIYLAYVNLYQGDPLAAYKLLSSGQKDTALLGTSQELEWLKAIILNDNNKQAQEVFKRPENVSVKLQAIYLLIQNHLTHNPELLMSELKNEMFRKIFIQSMYQYLQALNHVPKALRLPETVELTLLNFMHNSNELNLKMPPNFRLRYQALLKTKKVAWPFLENKQGGELNILEKCFATSEDIPDEFLEELYQALERDDVREREIAHAGLRFSVQKDLDEIEGNTLSRLYELPALSVEEIESKIDEKEYRDFVSQDLRKGEMQNNAEKRFRAFCENTLKPFLEKPPEENDGKSLIDKFDEDLNVQKGILNTLKKEILEKANKEVDLQKNAMHLLGKTIHRMTMQDLVSLFLQNNIGHYHKETLLSIDENRDLHQMMYKYLLQKNHCGRLEKAKKDLLDWEKNPKDSQALYDLGAHLYAKRHYKPHEHPDLLVLERYENILLRKEQVVILKSLLEKDSVEAKNKIIQLIMGGGKSKVIAPLLMRLNANENTLCVYRVPAALFETTLADLKRSYKKLFGKDVIPFKFSRAEPYSSTYLKNLFDQFQECMRWQNCVLSMGNAMRSLGLKYYDLLALLKKEPENTELWEQLKWVEALLALLKQKSYVLVDEADSELNIEEEINYPYGDEEGLDPTYNSAILDLHALLDSEFQANHENPLKNLPELVLEQEKSLLSELLVQLSTSEKKEADQKIVQYLENSSDKSVHEFIKGLPENVRDILAIYRYQIHHALPVLLQKRVDEHFGKSKIVKNIWDPVDEIPIPYVASQTPKEGSRFVNIYTAINNTIRLQKIQGISLPTFIQMIKNFQNAAEEEFATQKTRNMLTISDTNAAKEFAKITGLATLLRDIRLDDKSMLEALLKKISKKPSVVRYALEKIILPAVKTHKEMLNMNAIQEIDLYGHVDVMSGTLANSRTLHEDLHLDEENCIGIDGKTIDLLLTKKINLLSATGTTIQELVNDHFASCLEGPSKLHAIIDVGALFNDFKNEVVARAIAVKLSELNLANPDNKIEYVLFYNQNNILCALSVSNPEEPVKELGSSNAVVLKQLLGCDPDKCFTYYDQNHTRGTDIKQDTYAHAVMSVNKKTELKDVLQGAMRMRQFAQAQTINIILPPEVIQLLTEKSMKGVIDFTRKNQEETLKRQYYISTLKKIKEVFKKDLDERIKNKALTRAQKLGYYDAFSGFFVNELKISPYEQIGGLETSEDIENHLEDYRSGLEKSWKASLVKAHIVASKLDEDKVKKASSGIIEKMKPFLPALVSKQLLINRSNADTEMQSERQADRQQQAQQQQQQQAQQQQQQHTDGLVGHFSETVKHTDWNDEMWNAWCTGREHSSFNPIEPFLKGDVSVLQLSDALGVSQNFLDTFEGLKTLHFKAKKPMEYILMRQSTIGIRAEIITQIEAEELLKRIQKMDQKDDPTVWIETVNGTLYAGDFPKNYPEMTKEYNLIREQLHFLNGDIEVLTENFEQNKWFSADSYAAKMDYFKAHIAPDEALNAQNLSFVEDRLLKKLASPLKGKQALYLRVDDDPMPQAAILHYRRLSDAQKSPKKISSPTTLTTPSTSSKARGSDDSSTPGP